MSTDESAGTERLSAISKIIDNLKATYPDAKKLHIDLRFEWQETEFYTDGAELCPVVRIDVER